jgi:uncharacterized tellurite resistance protein B-like protein
MASIQSLMVQLEDGDDGDAHVYAIVDMQKQSENLALKLTREDEKDLIKILWKIL